MDLIKFQNLIKYCKSNVILDAGKLTTLENSVPGLIFKIFYSGQNQPKLEEEVSLLRWTNFWESELKHYNNQSKPYLKSLDILENHVKNTNNLSGNKIAQCEDIFLASYILEKGFNEANYQILSKWARSTLQGFVLPNPKDALLTQDNKSKKLDRKEKNENMNESKSGSGGKLKLLCLHGYRQSGQGFRTKTGSFRKATTKFADYSFVTAPHRVLNTADGGEIEEDQEQYGWWFSTPEKTYNAHHVSPTDCGFTESLDVVLKTIEEEGPFDGILAFSQGASLAGLLLAKQELGKVDLGGVKFCILVSAFISRCGDHQEEYSRVASTGRKINIPTLHIYGQNDKVVESEMSQELLQYFNNPVVIEHDGGHFVPTPGPIKQDLTKFFEDIKRLC